MAGKTLKDRMTDPQRPALPGMVKLVCERGHFVHWVNPPVPSAPVRCRCSARGGAR